MVCRSFYVSFVMFMINNKKEMQNNEKNMGKGRYDI